MNLAAILAMAPPAGADGQGGSMMPFLVLMVAMFAILYFFSVLPQKKRQKQLREMLDNLKKGDTVVTSAGIHGKITGKTETTITIEIDKGVKIKFDKAAITNKIEDTKEENKD